MIESKRDRSRRKTLEYVISTKFDAEDVRRSEKFWAAIGFIGALALTAIPGFYFSEIGIARFVLFACGAFAAVAVLFWRFSVSGNQALRDLHEYIDFEKLQSDLREGDT